MLATRVLAPASGGGTSAGGTNTYLVRDPASYRRIVVDPGPRNSVHLRRLVEAGGVELVLLTHGHPGHAEQARRIHELTGAPVRGLESAVCIAGARLTDGEVIFAGGTEVRVIATPGHTADSACFHLPRDRNAAGTLSGSILTGDTVDGRGVSVVAPPDGSLRSYVASLGRLEDFGYVLGLPGHGPRIDNLAAMVRLITARRVATLKAVVSALEDDTVASPASHQSRAARSRHPFPENVRPEQLESGSIAEADLEYLFLSAVDGIDPTNAPGETHAQ